MAKPRKPYIDFAVYLVVRFLICIIQALPIEAAVALADGLAWLAYTFDRRHRRVAEDNLRHAFPDITSSQEIDTRVRAVFRHFCRLVIDIAFLPRKLHANNWRNYVQMHNVWPMIDRLVSGRPVLLLTGHFGNWEMGGWTLGLLGFRTHAVARVLDNRYLEDFLRRFRESNGQRLLSKTGDVKRMQAILDAGGILATLADQDAGQRGLYVDFFNRPASTHKAVALLALEYQVPLVVIGVRKLDKPLHYQVIVEDVVLPDEYAGQPGAVKEMTQRFTTALERVIKTAPEQYFWLHRRWKHQPKAKKEKQAA
jgi:KDO2-lipid IV(A) lauroyltransferase